MPPHPARPPRVSLATHLEVQRRAPARLNGTGPRAFSRNHVRRPKATPTATIHAIGITQERERQRARVGIPGSPHTATSDQRAGRPSRRKSGTFGGCRNLPWLPSLTGPPARQARKMGWPSQTDSNGHLLGSGRPRGRRLGGAKPGRAGHTRAGGGAGLRCTTTTIFHTGAAAPFCCAAAGGLVRCGASSTPAMPALFYSRTEEPNPSQHQGTNGNSASD
jgi:hypothetical protein